jgi:hypothetical protein
MSIVSSRMNRPTTAGRTTAGGGPGQVLSLDRWIAGGLAGGVAGLLFSVVVPPADMMPMVAMLYGADGVVWGWLFHLLHSVAFGVAFAVLASVPGLLPVSLSLRLGAVVGAVYGVIIWVVFAAYVMPTWIGAVTDMDPPVPDWNRLSLVAHVVYGAAVGALLPLWTKAEHEPSRFTATQ